MSIDRSRGAPAAYRQIEAQLAERIEDGEYLPGMQLPSEAELVAEYGVARMTVRSALRQLVGRGLVEARQGIGVFVLAREQVPAAPPALDPVLVELRAIRALLERLVADAPMSTAEFREKLAAMLDGLARPH